jgi:serine/threonine-protein kinase HipA
VLEVFFGERLVGRIERSGPLLTFTYAGRWLETPGNFAISVRMPLAPETYPGEIATPWFANLLPEERQLERIGRLLGRDRGDVYGLLEEIGRDTAGALSIGGPEPMEAGRYRALDEKELAGIVERLPEHPLLAGEKDVAMSLAGAQTKLAVTMLDGRIFLPVRGAASTHILKPASTRLYATVENELFCLRLAAAVGIRVAAASMGRAGGRPYLLVERYDRRIIEPHRVARAHQEDFCQALGYYPTQKYEASGGPGLADLFGVLDRVTHGSALDRLALLDLIVFGSCIGDTDRHAKNFAMRLGPSRIHLAPGYDLMTALAYEGITENLAMKVAGVRRPEYIERRRWERFAGEIGLSRAAIVRHVGNLAERVQALALPLARDLAASAAGDGEALALFAERIVQRSGAVLAASTRGPSERDPPARRRRRERRPAQR